MLHQLANQLDQVILAVEGALLERLESGHLFGDVVLLERHQLKGQELTNVLGQELLALELTWVHGLDKVQLLDLLSGVR